jgi:thymidylate kinase
MKRKIKCIYIDGIEKSGKTSVIREMRKILKNKNKDLHEINGTNSEKLDQQESMLLYNNLSFILKENSLLSAFYKDIKENGVGIRWLEERYDDLIRRERNINHEHGSVHFFIIPEDDYSLKRIEDFDEKPEYLDKLISFYRNIDKYAISQGLDIKLITFDENDRIYDIRDKITKELEENYKI